jgi:hypothetical protein
MPATQNPLDVRVLAALRVGGGRLTVDQLAELLRVDRFSVAGALNRLGHLGAVRGLSPRKANREGAPPVASLWEAILTVQADGAPSAPAGKKKG